MTPDDDPQLQRPPGEVTLVGVARGHGETVHFVDDNFLRMLGYTREEFAAADFDVLAMTPPEHLHLDARALRELRELGGFSGPYRKDFLRRDGSRVSVLVVGARLAASDEWLAYVVDLTSRSPATSGDVAADLGEPSEPDFLVRLIAELVRERDRLTTMLDSTSAMVWAVDPDLRLVGANAAFFDMMDERYGVRPAFGDVILRPEDPAETTEVWRSLYERALRGEQFSNRTRYERRRHSEILDTVFSPMLDADGAVVGVTMVSHSVSAQVHAEEGLRTSESRFRTLAEASPLGIFELDVDGRCTFVNERMAEIWELEVADLLAEGTMTAIHPTDAEAVRADWARAIAAGRPLELEYRVLLPDGAPRYVRTWLRPVGDDRLTGFVGSVEDETARRLLGLRIRQTERLESLGTLAGGIAHDFNNLLAVIMGNIELAQLTGDDTARNDFLDQVRDASLRARDLVRQILTFSRQADQERVPLDLVDAVTGCMRLLRASIPSNIALDTDFTFGPVVVDADESGLQQVLVNLCVNSSHALRGRPDGQIVVRVRRDEHQAILTVSDNGKGMTPEVQQRALEPFFSTKSAVEGTGMGLAVVHGIVTVHGGTITIESTPERGTDVHVGLPLSTSTIAGEGEPAPVRTGTTTTARILLVEDEAAIASVVTEVLRHGGHEVTWLSDGTAALARFRATPDEFDVLISDVTLPGLSGDQVAERIHAIRPTMPLILMTGYSALVDAEGARAVGATYLQKPFGVVELERAVADAIEHQGAPPPSPRA